MQFTGANLQLLKYALSLAIDELHNQAATCPDVVEYAEKLRETAALRLEYREMLQRVNKAIKRERERKR